MYPDPEAPVGFTVADAKLGQASRGSVEAALAAAGLGERATLTALAGAPDLCRVRSQSADLSIDVPAAFDAVLSSPTVT